MGLRVTEEEELEGLDLAEHGGHAYDMNLGSGYIESPTRAAAAAPLATSVAATEPV
jgi:hypothetical protein